MIFVLTVSFILFIIVRTKIIGHHSTLVQYIYLAELPNRNHYPVFNNFYYLLKIIQKF